MWYKPKPILVYRFCHFLLPFLPLHTFFFLKGLSILIFSKTFFCAVFLPNNLFTKPNICFPYIQRAKGKSKNQNDKNIKPFALVNNIAVFSFFFNYASSGSIIARIIHLQNGNCAGYPRISGCVFVSS